MITSRRPGLAMLWKTGLALTAARAAVKLTPPAKLMLGLPRRAVATPANAQVISDLVRALDAWSRRMPWRTLCFERGIAAYRLLTHRGCSATLFYGAAMFEGELKAHVWVRSGDRDVVGCENCGDFAILSHFSNDSSSSQVQP